MSYPLDDRWLSVLPGRLELPTYWLKASYSNQLSYERVCGDIGSRNLRQSACKANPLVPQLIPKIKRPLVKLEAFLYNILILVYTIQPLEGLSPFQIFITAILLFTNIYNTKIILYFIIPKFFLMN